MFLLINVPRGVMRKDMALLKKSKGRHPLLEYHLLFINSLSIKLSSVFPRGGEISQVEAGKGPSLHFDSLFS